MSFEKFMNEALSDIQESGTAYVEVTLAGTSQEKVIFYMRENGDMFTSHSKTLIEGKEKESLLGKLEMGFYKVK